MIPLFMLPICLLHQFKYILWRKPRLKWINDVNQRRKENNNLTLTLKMTTATIEFVINRWKGEKTKLVSKDGLLNPRE